MRQVAVEADQQVRPRRDAGQRLLAARQHQRTAPHAGRHLDVEHADLERRRDVLAVAAQAAVDVRVDARAGFELQRVQVERVAVGAQRALQVRGEERELGRDLRHHVAHEHDREAAGADEVAVQVVDREQATGTNALRQAVEVVRREGVRSLAVSRGGHAARPLVRDLRAALQQDRAGQQRLAGGPAKFLPAGTRPAGGGWYTREESNLQPPDS